MKPDMVLMARLREATLQLMKDGPLAATASIREALAQHNPDSVQDTSRSVATPEMKDLNAAPAWTGSSAAAGPEAEEAPMASAVQGLKAMAAAGLPDIAALVAQHGITLPKSVAEAAAGRRRAPLRAPPLPDGARYVALSYEGPAGQRNYKLYIPSTCTGQPAALLVMLHGCTQDADDFAAGTRMNRLAEEAACLVVWPEQSQQANSSRCWNWFSAADQQRGKGEPALIVGIVRQVMANHPVDSARICIAGLSAGGAMAAVVGALYPEVFHAVGVHSGLPFGAAHDLPSALQSMRTGASGTHRHGSGPKVIVMHGDRDATVHPANGQHIVAAAAASHSGSAPVSQTGKAPGGRRYTRSRYQDGNGQVIAEHWVLHGAGHAWAGGSADGTYTDCAGPDASRAMLQFFGLLPRREGSS
ncbi:extracellular catalytic domain type 1 short-chain-length polyhydroxyalkanoate depolymerase [Massilia endophytica]|uniref:extracellular catalytic domain type 1 short-chain-length polyhydroxyalkanoate depolymerase n=1 Tax=Massilia endophytica TaxID=2899220 RepID=UPI001E479898|nr:PHB depolymerase family esterase [Massilia endophytica]UGQ45873.1 PHB depolymerase family esterase [Massilia endophytica]